MARMDAEAPLCAIGCPREPGRVCTLWVKPAPDAEWENHGTKDSPTITPSYNCIKGCGFHGYIVDGKLVDAPKGGISTMHVCASCKHPEIHTVHIQPIRQLSGAAGLSVKISKTVVRPTS
jgi:hypothetical protein